jgi:hypothetical protein
MVIGPSFWAVKEIEIPIQNRIFLQEFLYVQIFLHHIKKKPLHCLHVTAYFLHVITHRPQVSFPQLKGVIE